MTELAAANKERLSEETMLYRVACEFKDGDVVNLGAGIATSIPAMGLVMNSPDGREVMFHFENGILNFGEATTDPALGENIGFGSMLFTPKPGMSVFDLTESFSIIRGGHIDITVLGALQVSEAGDLANNTLPGKQIGSYGGAPDLATNAKRVIIATTHNAKDGTPKIVSKCTLPLTVPRCVDLIVTDVAVIEVTDAGLVLKEVAPGWTPAEVQAITDARLIVKGDVPEMALFP